MGSSISQMRSSPSSSSRESVNNNRQQIPEDVILDILSRLPAKSIVRFRRVSRTWCSFIHDPFFASLHHARSITRDKGNALLLSYPDPSSSSTSFSFFERKQGFRNLQISHVDQQYACLSEIIRGILCIHDRRSHRVDICNITTQETITLPRSTNIPIRPGAGVDFDIVYEPRYSFGFNSTTGDYKVLNICCITGYKLQVNPINGLSTREVSRKTVEFEIFTIGCDRGAGSWRKIDPGYPYDQELYGLTSESVCADGVIHWRHRLLDQEILLAFDLQQEKFQIIQVPKEALGFQLMKQVKGCLVLMGHVTSGYNRNKIDLWILEDRRDQVWMKETVLFPSYSPCLWPVGSFKTGLILLAQHGCANPAAWAAYYCDLETKNICMIHVPELKSVKLPCGEVGKPSDVVLTVHAENLLSLTSNAYEHAGKKG
ncbi:hypothetical protein OIU84_008343 [Salix udensis]|uniref:F-box domain-containing protein n=1 Tax=Salix udensis TaxID=889485 RepID=A0AAD6JV44_9ROSI|nr:hypothetical protein OIU84_008343 [Salix udensis]